jgi:dihydrofolate reductase
MISIIVAAADNYAIGKNNNLLWDLPDDMRFFKEKTKGHCIITGRKNYESIPAKFRPLPQRVNIVVTRQAHYDAGGAIVVSSLEKAIQKAEEVEDREIFIIGGGEIYKEALPLADRLYITRVHHDFDADTFFPEIHLNDWVEIARKYHPKDDRHPYDFTFLTYDRRNPFNG